MIWLEITYFSIRCTPQCPRYSAPFIDKILKTAIINIKFLSCRSLQLEIVCLERRPNCQRCAQHNLVNRLKGHKRVCAYRECTCAKCQVVRNKEARLSSRKLKVVAERQRLMADQIKLRRKQKKEKLLLQETPPSTVPPPSSQGL